MKKITFLFFLFFMCNLSVGNFANGNVMDTVHSSILKTDLSDGIEQNNPEDPFSIYPNPVTKGFVTIQSQSDAPKDIFIFDVLGKEIVRTTLKGNRLDISSLESGIYILKVIQGKASVTKKLIVK